MSESDNKIIEAEIIEDSKSTKSVVQVTPELEIERLRTVRVQARWEATKITLIWLAVIASCTHMCAPFGL